MINSRFNLILLLIIFCLEPVGAVEETVEFTGIPVVRIDTSGDASSPNRLTKNKANEAILKIVRVGDQYLWRSRGDILMNKVSGGAFLTYIAENGSGYVRIINPALKSALCEPGKETLDCKYSYVEHLTALLSSVTYYGN